MSFGWSAGDIAVAVKFLCKIGVALKESGGASSEFQDTVAFLQTLSLTLRHISALQNVEASQDLEITGNLRAHCTLIREPVGHFLREIQAKYEHQLGQDSKWFKLQPAWKKIRWATSISEYVKRLEARITMSMTAIAVIMLHQVSITFSGMPEDIQQAISHKFETKINSAVGTAMISLTANTTRLQAALMDHSTQIIQATGEDVVSKLDAGISGLQTSLDGMRLADTRTTAAIMNLSSKIESKLANAVVVLNATSKRTMEPSDRGISVVTQDLLRAIWCLLACIQGEIHKLMIIFMPYIFMLCRNAVQPLLLCGDHFRFEDALGREWKLSCAEHQSWEMFEKFLHKAFDKSYGLPYVQDGLFVVNNAYNNLPISAEVWQTALQPGSRIVMNILILSPYSIEFLSYALKRSPNVTCDEKFKHLKADRLHKCLGCWRALSRFELGMALCDPKSSGVVTLSPSERLNDKLHQIKRIIKPPIEMPSYWESNIFDNWIASVKPQTPSFRIGGFEYNTINGSQTQQIMSSTDILKLMFTTSNAKRVRPQEC